MNELSRHAVLDQDQPWRLMPRFVLRSPGFPFDWLERLTTPESWALAAEVAALQAQQRQRQHEFESILFPRLCDEETRAGRDKETFRSWYRLARTIRRGEPAGAEQLALVAQAGRPEIAAWLEGWQQIAGRLKQLEVAGPARLADELANGRRELHDLVARPLFQEALWLSNPAIYETGWSYFNRHWEPERRPAKIKHLERRFYTYLQRFCAKNDTSSFFGPLNYGDLAGPGVFCRRSSQRLPQRRVFFAYWAAAALAAQIAAEPEIKPHLKPRCNPSRPARGLYGLAAVIYELSDGTRSITDLAATLDSSVEQMLADAGRLVDTGMLHLDLPIPPATLEPLAYLERQVAAFPPSPAQERWLAALRAFQADCAAFGWADLAGRQAILAAVEARFAELTDAAARRGQGQMFQDRTLLYEECQGSIEQLHLGAEQGRRISAALAPIADLCATYGQLIHDDLQRIGLDLFDRLRPDGTPCSLVQFMAAWGRQYPELPRLSAAEDLQQQFAGLVARRSVGQRCDLTAGDIAPLIQPLRRPVVFSPDLMLAAGSLAALERGEYQVVLGEIHHGVQPVGWMLSFVADLPGWERAIAACLPAPAEQVQPANLVFDRRMKTAPPEFDGLSVQVSGVSERPRQLELRTLMVERAGDRLQVRAPGNKRALMFYPPSFYVPPQLYAPFACFSYPLVQAIPVRLCTHTPQIVIAGVVYQRERWDLPAEQLAGIEPNRAPFQLMTDLAALQQRLGLPDHLFVRTPGEPKPFYINLQSYFALELLAHLAPQAATISMTEMLPGPGELWLRDADGRYCCELRMVMSRAAAEAATPEGHLRTENHPEGTRPRTDPEIKGELEGVTPLK